MNKFLQRLIFAAVLCNGAGWALAGQEAAGSRLVTLREAVGLALARQPEILLAQVEIAKSAEALREARSANLPQVTTGTGLAYNNGFPLSIEGSAPSIFQAAFSQSILSKKNQGLVREAEAGSAAVRANSESVRNAVVARTIMIYNELYQANLAIPVLREQQAAAVTESRILDTLLAAGRARPVDADLKKIEVANLEHQLLVVRERAGVAAAELHALTGIPDNETIGTERPELASEMLSLPLDVLYKRALETHPGIREAEANVRARESHIDVERGAGYPQLNIISQYALFSKTNNYQDFFNRFTRNNYILGLSVQIPVFTGFRTSARVAQSRNDAEIARLQLQRLKDDLRLNLQKAESAVRIATGAAGLARLEASACERKLKVNENLLEAGRIEPRALTETRAELLVKKAAVIEAERILLEKQLALLQASGSLAALF